MQENPAFLYGESVFVTLRVEAGVPLFRNQQLRRLERFITEYYLQRGFKESEQALLNEMLMNECQKLHSCILKMMVYSNKRESLMANSVEFEDLNIKFYNRELSELRDQKLKSLESPFTKFYPSLKMGSYMPHFYLKKMAIRDGFDDCLFVRDEQIVEASTSNVFFMKNDILYTPKETIYSGLTREAMKKYFDVRELDINLGSISDYDYAFLTNSASIITSIKQIDNVLFETSETLSLELKNKMIIRGRDGI